VKNKFEDVFKKIGAEAKIKGFRPGHIPRDILEKEFSSVAHEQVMRELIPDLYQKALDEHKLEVIEMPDISDVKLDRGSLSFKAAVEIQPEIVLPKYKGIKLEFKKITVPADEIKRQLDSIKESRKIESLDDTFARSVGYPALAELEKAIERQIAVQKDNAQRQEMEKSLLDQLTKSIDIKLPQAMVNKQLEEMVRKAKVDLMMRGVSKDRLDSQDKALRDEIEPEARMQVKVYLTLQAIAKKEDIALDDHMPAKVIEMLYKEADWQVKE
jgi:FKBP-type peptidyl-prolyl cis-trans isomerase (trigger factor)